MQKSGNLRTNQILKLCYLTLTRRLSKSIITIAQTIGYTYVNKQTTYNEPTPESQTIYPNSLLCGAPLALLQLIPVQSVTLVLTNPPFALAMIPSVSVSPGKQLLKELKRIVKPDGNIVTIAPAKKKISDQTIEQIIEVYSKPEDTVLDFNMQQGAIVAACKKLNRKFIGIEENKELFDKACKKLKPTKKRKSTAKKKPKAKKTIPAPPKEPEFLDDFDQIDMFD